MHANPMMMDEAGDLVAVRSLPPTSLPFVPQFQYGSAPQMGITCRYDRGGESWARSDGWTNVDFDNVPPNCR